MNAQVFLADARRGQVSGLLGNANGNPADDLTTRDGLTTLTSPASFEEFYKTYVQSWRITQATSLFDYGDAESTSSPDITNLNFPFLLETAQSLSSARVQAAMAICQAAGVTSDWMNACVLDVGVSNGDAGATSAASGFAGVPPVTSTFDIQPPAVSDDGISEAGDGASDATLPATGLTGSEVAFSVHCCTSPPNASNLISSIATAIVGPGIEFPAISSHGASVINANVDVSSNAISIQYVSAAQALGGAFN